MNIPQHQRPGVGGVFSGVAVARTAYKAMNLPALLRKTIRQKLPSKAKFTIKMDTTYDYNRFTPDPDEVFEESVTYLDEVKAMLIDLKDNDTSYEDHLVESMVQMIFTSNTLENAGAGHPVTLRLCKEILAGKDVGEIGVRDDEYDEIQKYLIEKYGKSSEEAILRSRQQICQHAWALKYMVHRMVINGEQLSEEILKETHQILTHGIDAENEERDGSETYGGVYRTDMVGWGFTNFAAPKDIPRKVAAAIDDFNAAAKEAEMKKFMDPYAFSSKYYHTILNIHPFLDGNSRLCRLLLNTILLKYTGIMIPIGTDPIEAAKWKDVTQIAAQIETADKEDSGGMGKPAWAEVSTLVAIQARSTLRHLKERLTAGKAGKVFHRRKSITAYHWSTSESEEDEYGMGKMSLNR
jgi:fido (protein-threonine AMPylation protein)